MSSVPTPSLLDELENAAVHHTTSSGEGSRMIWRRWGSGPPVVLLHGGAGSWMHWVRNIGPLAEKSTIWAPDLPGFGDSDLPEGVADADSIAPIVLRGVQELMQGEQFDIIGFSFGALVAAYMAAEAPPTLRRMILISVNGMGLLDGSEPLSLRSLRGVHDPEARRAITRCNLGLLMFADAGRIDDLAIAVQERGVLRERAKGRNLVMTDVLFSLARRWDCTVDAIWGSEDPAYRQQLNRLRETAGRLGLRGLDVMEGAGHWLPYECAGELNPLLLSRLAA